MERLTNEQRLDRFRVAGMILGGCPIDDKQHPVEIPGWMTRFADEMGYNRGNLSQILLGHRPLPQALEDKLAQRILQWRDEQIPRIRIALYISAQIETTRRAEREAEALAAELDDGPAPGFGG